MREWRETATKIEPGVREGWETLAGGGWVVVNSGSAVELANARVVGLLAPILANAILLEHYGGRPSPKSAQAKERLRAATRRRVAKRRRVRQHGIPARTMAGFRKDFLEKVTLEAHERAFHVQREAASKGRPPSPGLDHFASGAKTLFSALRGSDLVGLRIRAGFPWWKALWVILSEVPEAKQLYDHLPKNRGAEALSKLAARL